MSTRMAKLVYRISGKLSRIKTPRRTYTLNYDEVTDTFSSYRNPKRDWLPCQISFKLLSKSMSMDPDHWDHWALVHDTCEGTVCDDCKGIVCGKDERDGDEAGMDA